MQPRRCWFGLREMWSVIAQDRQATSVGFRRAHTVGLNRAPQIQGPTTHTLKKSASVDLSVHRCCAIQDHETTSPQCRIANTLQNVHSSYLLTFLTFQWTSLDARYCYSSSVCLSHWWSMPKWFNMSKYEGRSKSFATLHNNVKMSTHGMYQ